MAYLDKIFMGGCKIVKFVKVFFLDAIRYCVCADTIIFIPLPL